MSNESMKQKRARSARVAASAGGALAAAFMSLSSSASAQEFGERRPIEDNAGPGINVRPAPYFPSRGNTGVAVDTSATYGVPAGPLVLAPGGRFAAYFGSNG